MLYSYSCKRLAFSLATAIFSCFSAHSHAQTFDGAENRFTATGYSFSYATEGVIDEQILLDPVQGKEVKKITEGPLPATMNGKKIYELKEVTTVPTPRPVNMPAEEYILYNIKQDKNLKELPDGTLYIHLRNIVVDENGKIRYFNYSGTRFSSVRDIAMRSVNDDNIIQQLKTLVANAPAMQPAMLNGKKVPVRLNTALTDYKVVVKDHVLSYSKLGLMDIK